MFCCTGSPAVAESVAGSKPRSSRSRLAPALGLEVGPTEPAGKTLLQPDAPDKGAAM
jgi:hypothetical protein